MAKYKDLYWSQEGEDIILRRLFENRSSGFYIDIGALHPFRFSNTYYFYRKGWRGINIEANPESIELFEKFRKRDINLNIAVGLKKGKMKYYMFNEPALNTFDEELAKQRDGLNDFKIVNIIEVEMLPLSEILDIYLPKNQKIDFMNIDVEGLDFEVLQSNNWEKYKPEVLLVEIIPAKSIEEVLEHNIYKYLNELGYYILAKTFNTVIFKLRCTMKFAPVVLFVYNRPWHTIQTVEALKKNELASESELFIFSDGWKNEQDKPKVLEVREYLKTINGFKKVHIIERERNYGLADNIIDGVTKVVNEYGRIIVLEDDIVTSPYFLRYMNDSLDRYKDIDKVFGVTGYAFPIKKEGLPPAYFLRFLSCWGWGTYARSWKFFEKNSYKLINIFSKEMIKEFDFNNSGLFWSQVIANNEGKLNTWAIFYYATLFLNNGLFLMPRESFSKNIGHDDSGIHCGRTKCYDVDLTYEYNIAYPDVIEELPLARKRFIKFFRSLKVLFAKGY